MLGSLPVTDLVPGQQWDPATAAVMELTDGSLGLSTAVVDIAPTLTELGGIPIARDWTANLSTLSWARSSAARADRLGAGSQQLGSPLAEQFPMTEQAAQAAFSLPSSASRRQLGLSTAMQSRLVDWIFTKSSPTGSEEAAALVSQQPQLAPEDVESNAPPAVAARRSTLAQAVSAETASTVELHASAAAALVFAWQVRRQSADAEANRRQADFYWRRWSE